MINHTSPKTNNTKAIVISDTHGNAHLLSAVLKLHPDANYIFHLGDGVSDIKNIAHLYQKKTIISVSGNCDYPRAGEYPDKLLEIAGLKILAAHGHTLGVKSGLVRAVGYARAKGADILLFGHTHRPLSRYLPPDGKEKGLYLFNPGSLGLPPSGRPSFGILKISEGNILLSHAKL